MEKQIGRIDVIRHGQGFELQAWGPTDGTAYHLLCPFTVLGEYGEETILENLKKLAKKEFGNGILRRIRIKFYTLESYEVVR